MAPLLVTFAGGGSGTWEVERIEAVNGAPLPDVERLAVVEGADVGPATGFVWALRGVTSNERYVGVTDRAELVARQQPLGRPDASRAALIPITKASAWWDMTQEERLEIFAGRPGHVRMGLEYLPAVARRLHHGRDLGEEFDFLTWFEYPVAAAGAFEELVARLRATPEWSFVEREIDIRLVRAPGGA
jgi:hypothetical protein